MSTDVAVVVPAYDAEHFVEQALRSVLDQTVPPRHIVVVDDGSTDDTATVAESLDDPRVTVVRRPHTGVGPTRNAGLAAAADTGAPFVALLDADDVWLPTKLERQLAAFADDPTRDAVFTWFDEFADTDHPPPPGTRAPLRAQTGTMASGPLLRRAAVERIGPFGTGPTSEWVGWWAHARALGVVTHTVPEVLYRRRIHGANHSFVHADQGQELLAVARHHLGELRARRAQGSAR